MTPDTDSASPEPSEPKRDGRHGTLRAVAKGGSFLAAGDAFNYVSRMIAALVLAKALGADQYGLYNLAVSSAFVFSGVADFGMATAMERFIAVMRQRGDDAQLRGSTQVGVWAAAIGGVTIAIVVGLLADQIAVGVFDDPRLGPLIRLIAIIIPILALENVLAAVVRGFKRMDQSAFASDFIQPLVRLILILIFAVTGLNAVVAGIIFGVSYLASLLTLVRLAPTHFEPLDTASPAVRPTRELIRFGFPFWLTTVLTKVRKNVQTVLLGVFSTATSVGVFSLASSANIVGRISNVALATSMRPVLAELFDREDMEGMSHLYKATTRWTLTLNLPVTVLLVSYPTAILGVFGQSFEAGATALTVLALSELANAITGTCGSIIDMSGRGVLKLINKVVEIGLLIGGNLLLIPRYGVLGAALAVLGGTAILNLMRVVEIWWFARLQPYEWKTLKPMAAASVAIGAGMLFNGFIPASGGFGHLVLNTLVSTSVYLVALVLFGLPSDERMILRSAQQRLFRLRRQRQH